MQPKASNRLAHYLSEEQIANLDQFDIAQLNYVLSIGEQHSSMASAGRVLFDVSRPKKAQAKDSTRLQKYLRKFDLEWSDLA